MLLSSAAVAGIRWDDVTVERLLLAAGRAPFATSAGQETYQHLAIMRILLSNDDGSTRRIQTRRKHLREFADVQVVAPDRNRSGALPNSC